MKYSYEFKLKCVKLYQEKGIYHPTPKGVNESAFKNQIRKWHRLVTLHGSNSLKRKSINKEWTPEEKIELIQMVKNGKSVISAALLNGINEGQLYSWIKKYDTLGYNGLINTKKGRSSKKNNNMNKDKTIKPKELIESEREELIRLRIENNYIKTEIEVLKKEIALREEKEAAYLKAKKQRLSKN